MRSILLLTAAVALLACVAGQRITTIQLDGTQYFISRMNPYAPKLNYFLAYQYCRSIGLQLASFETKEKSDSIMQYLTNAGYNKYDFWTSGNRLGTNMMIWMSTGLPFNATFNYMRDYDVDQEANEFVPMARQLSAVEQRNDNDTTNGCILLRAPDLYWEKDDCTKISDFICEQTRCYYYNYGSIPVSSAQGNKLRFNKTATTTTKASSETSPTSTSTSTSETTPSTTTSTTTTTEQTVTEMEEPVEEIYEESEIDNTAQDTEIDNLSQVSEIPNNQDTSLNEEQTESNTPTLEQNKSRGDRILDPTTGIEMTQDTNFPWSWARNIMLEKPVLKKSGSV